MKNKWPPDLANKRCCRYIHKLKYLVALCVFYGAATPLAHFVGPWDEGFGKTSGYFIFNYQNF